MTPALAMRPGAELPGDVQVRAGQQYTTDRSRPVHMGVLVASSMTESGSTIDGTWGSIVVVKTDAGYAPNPGHAGVGKIVATFCP